MAKVETPYIDLLKHGIAELEKSVARLAALYEAEGETFSESQYVPLIWPDAAIAVARYQRNVEEEIKLIEVERS